MPAQIAQARGVRMKMIVPLQWTTAVIGLAIAMIIIVLIRKDALHVRHAIWWLIIAAGSVVLGFFPRLMDTLGVFLGVYYPPILFLTLAMGMVLIKVLTMDIERSRQERALRRLNQRMAILEEKLDWTHTEKTTHKDSL